MGSEICETRLQSKNGVKLGMRVNLGCHVLQKVIRAVVVVLRGVESRRWGVLTWSRVEVSDATARRNGRARCAPVKGCSAC